jgi:alanine dehydrogenase
LVLLADKASEKEGAMRIGVAAEVKEQEHRVAITPAGVRELATRGHEVVIESGAGLGSGIEDVAFEHQGARMVSSPEEVFEAAELVLGVKEPQPQQVPLLREGQVLFTYLHLAPAADLAEGLCRSGATCVAYETVEDEQGRLPLLAPMSEVAGKLATQAGAFMLARPTGGCGVLMGGVPGVPPASVMVIGGGTVGLQAAVVARGMGARVAVFDLSLERLRDLDQVLGDGVSTIYTSSLAIEEHLPQMDLVIGCVLVPGARAPHVITREQLKLTRPGAVLVDVAIDQGGCFETSRPTTHEDPTYLEQGVLHYCVANMPGAVPVSSTHALTNATLPYVTAIADAGLPGAVELNPGLLRGVNVVGGAITHPAVASALEAECVDPAAALGFAGGVGDRPKAPV